MAYTNAAGERSRDSLTELMTEGQFGIDDTPHNGPKNRNNQGVVPLLALYKGTDTSHATSISRPDSMRERLVDRTSTRTAQWQLHWRTPRLLIITFLVGLSAALGQHCLYSFLHYKTEDRENTKAGLVLCGRALAYLAKVAFAHCIVICYRQRIWRTFRERALSIRSIDQLLSGTEDILLFANWEALSNAPLLSGMALVVWLLPIATVIASPSALSFGWRPEIGDAYSMVPTLNFSIESYNNWRSPIKLPNGNNKRSLLFYNTTDMKGSKPGWFDYYDQPSFETRNILWRSLFSSPRDILKNTFNQEMARLTSCGGNYNCTYSINFLGPGYRCVDVTSQSGGIFNTSMLVPEGSHIYYADVDTGQYQRPQIENVTAGPSGIPQGDTPDHAGDLRFDPELWIGYAFNTTKTLPSDSPFAKNWTHEFEPHIARCIHYETRYTVNFNFTGQTCEIKSTSDFLAPSLGLNFSHLNDGKLPMEDWLNPRDDMIIYKKTAAYYALGEVFRDLLRGKIVLHAPKPGPHYSEEYTDISKTSLLQGNRLPRPDMVEQLETLYGDMVLTILASPNMIVTSKEEVLVHRTRYRLAFIYDSGRLWACYAPAILLTLIILLIGAWTIWEDGITFSTAFSRILATTRNPTLDKISKGACLGNDPFPEELMQRKLRFGALQEDTIIEDISNSFTRYQNVGHCAFGVPTEVTSIRKGGLYAGINFKKKTN